MPKALTGNRPKGFGCAVALVGAVLAGGLGATVLVAAGPLARIVRSRGWAPTSCTILSSALRRERGDTATYSVDVRYRWSISDQTFEGTRYDLVGASTSNRAHWERVVQRLAPGTTVECWIDPRRPSEAALVRAVHAGDLLLFLIPVAFAALAGLGLRALYKQGLANRVRWTPPGPEVTTEVGPVALAPASTPGRRLAVTLFVAVLWNGFVWLALFGSMVQTGRRSPNAVLEIVLALFALVGAYPAYQAARALVALAAPRVRVTASARRVRTGDRLTVDWRFRGRDDAISTVTTFTAPNNEIRWAVVVEAELRHLPDLREEFPVVVLPEPR